MTFYILQSTISVQSTLHFNQVQSPADIKALQSCIILSKSGINTVVAAVTDTSELKSWRVHINVRCIILSKNGINTVVAAVTDTSELNSWRVHINVRCIILSKNGINTVVAAVTDTVTAPTDVPRAS
ncbi:hypothetical protein J6590_092217 [Homalodisca vitripennis]|nr:hypothetical protein J6590_092217 [Homalodisca vitripennis]